MQSAIDEILEALKVTVESVEFDPTPVVFVDEPVSLKPASVVLVLSEIERGNATVAESEIGSYDWTLMVEAQLFFELTKRTTSAQIAARQYAEMLIRSIDQSNGLGSDLAMLLTDDAKASRAVRIGPTEDTDARMFECWTVQIELPALLTY